MKDFQPARENNLYNREAVVCGGVCNGRKAWILPGQHITHSREVADKALRIMGRMIGGSANDRQ